MLRLHAATRRHLLLGFVLFVLALSLAAHIQQPVRATSNYLNAFRSTYPATAGSQLDNCTVCHSNIPNLNPFGQDFRAHNHSFIAIEGLDSDSDGFANLVEIEALTFPGDPASRPATTQPTATATATQPPRSNSPTPTATATTPPAQTATPTPTVRPGGEPAPGAYQLIGWNDLGMHCMNESFANIAILPPYNNLWAQLIRTGPEPEIVTEDVVITYRFQNNSSSAGKTDFWDYVKQIFGMALPPDVGLTGAGLSGTMQAESDHFLIEGVPLTPYEDNKPHIAQPYQLADLIARDATSGEILATTTFVAPVSTEMHCADCHSDGMEDIATGEVEANILTLHDQEEGTRLMAQRPVLCANCHGSNALGMSGNPDLPNLSLAIHRAHSEDDEGDNECEAGEEGDDCGRDDMIAQDAVTTGESPTCYQCHPGPETACLRGTMAASGLTCESCHGGLQDLADPAREPWVDLPRCATCHGTQYGENPGKLFRQSTGHGGLYCEACHGSTHAILPSTEPRDNLQVIRLQGFAGTLSDCHVCHGDAIPDGPGPHDITDPPPGWTPTPTPDPVETPEPTETPEVRSGATATATVHVTSNLRPLYLPLIFPS